MYVNIVPQSGVLLKALKGFISIDRIVHEPSLKYFYVRGGGAGLFTSVTAWRQIRGCVSSKPGKHLTSGRNHAGMIPGWRVSPAVNPAAKGAHPPCTFHHLLSAGDPHGFAHYVATEKSPQRVCKITCTAPRPRPEAAKLTPHKAPPDPDPDPSLTRSSPVQPHRYSSPFQNSEHVCAHFYRCLCPSASAGADGVGEAASERLLKPQ